MQIINRKTYTVLEENVRDFSQELLGNQNKYFKKCTEYLSEFKKTHCINKHWKEVATKQFKKWQERENNHYFKNHQKLFIQRSNSSKISRSIASEK